MADLRVGAMLYDHTGDPLGAVFSGDYLGWDIRVEAIGADWVVARGEDGEPRFAAVNPDTDLERWRTPNGSR